MAKTVKVTVIKNFYAKECRLKVKPAFQPICLLVKPGKVKRLEGKLKY